MTDAISAVVLLAIWLTPVAVWAQTPSGPPPTNPIGPSAIWQPDLHFLAAVKKECRQPQFPNFEECFVAQMEKSGAPADAVAFTRQTGNTGYLRDFRKVGRVDIAYVSYPFRANQNQVWLLVNGDPGAVDVDDFKLLPVDNFSKNSTYAALAKKYPKISVWPGDRSGTKYPLATVRSSGGQSFIVEYNLQDGCRGCARLATARLAFDFDADGKFLGAKLERIRALPPQGN